MIAPVPVDVFSTDPWFSNLLKNGFVKKPFRYFVLPLKSSASRESSALHLVQHKKNGPVISLANYYSGLYGPAGTPESLQTLSLSDWQAAARLLRAAGTRVVRLQPVEKDGLWVVGLQEGLGTQGYWTDHFFCCANWYQNVPEGGFETYWLQRPSALQNSIARGRRRLSRAGAWRAKVHAQVGDDLEAAMAAYEQVYAQSWKTAEPCEQFMPGLLRTAAREGWLRLGVLWLDGQPLAAQVWLVHGNKANIYKLAYVQGMEHFSPGSVLTAALMEHAMDVDGVQEVDYLTGDDPYKRDWMQERRERIGILAFDKYHWRGWLAAGRHFMGRWARKYRLRQGETTQKAGLGNFRKGSCVVEKIK